MRFERRVKRAVEFKVSEEVAIDQVNDLLDYYELDIESLPKGQAENINSVLENLVKAVRLGRLEIQVEDGISVVQMLQNNETKIEYKEINGRAKTAMGSKKEADGNGRLYAVMGALSDGEASILKLKGPDISLVENLGTVFLLV